MGVRGQLVDKSITTTSFPDRGSAPQASHSDLQSKPAGGYIPNRRNRNEACL